MGSSDFDPKAWRQAARNIEIVVKAGEEAMQSTMRTFGVEITNVLKILLTHPPVSVPGEPPGLRTGGLRLSYNWDVVKTGANEVSLSVGSDASTRRPITGEAVDYAKYLEFGTRIMAPRPHLRPAVAIVLPLIGPNLVTSCYVAQKAAATGLRGTDL